jgi:DNA repair protein RadC
VARRALHHNAAAVILAHNHPSGITEPSRADLSLTCELMEVLRMFDVKVLDHFVVSGTDATSLMECGLLGMRDFPVATRRKRSRKTKPAAE